MGSDCQDFIQTNTHSWQSNEKRFQNNTHLLKFYSNETIETTLFVKNCQHIWRVPKKNYKNIRYCFGGLKFLYHVLKYSSGQCQYQWPAETKNIKIINKQWKSNNLVLEIISGNPT